MTAQAGPTCAPAGAAPGLAYTLAFLAFFAHAIDVLIRLPGWAAARAIALQTAGFGNAVLGLMLIAAVILVLGRTLQFNRPAQIVVAVATAALLATVALHVVVSLVTGSLVPGLFTAVLLVLPTSVWLIARLPLGAIEKARAGLLGSALMPVLAGATLWLGGALG